MVDNNELFEEILLELSYRSDEGYPDFSKPQHITILSEILTEWGLTDVKFELIKNLLKEEEEKPLDTREKERAEKMGLKWLGKGYGKDDGKGVTHKNVDGKLVKVDKDGKEETEKDTTKLTAKDFDYTKDKKKEEPKKSDYESVVASSKQKVKELYGEDGGGELLQKSKTSNDALKNGYVKGADWVAPGNAGSNFNENISNEGALILEKYPDLSEDELVNILFEKTKNSELGKQQKKTTIDGSDKGNVPEEIPTTDRDLYKNCIITARSAKSKYNRAKKAKEAAAEAQIELDKQKKAIENLDTSNPYQNMENTMEDLTVNQAEAEFTRQQQQQNQANIMQQMRGAAGGSGIAALAQTLANQGSIDAQKAAASIGKQESANQMAAAKEAAAIQSLEREGDLMSRRMQQGKIGTLAQMAMKDKVAAEEARAAGQAQMIGGITDTLGAASGALTGQFGEGLQAKLSGLIAPPKTTG